MVSHFSVMPRLLWMGKKLKFIGCEPRYSLSEANPAALKNNAVWAFKRCWISFEKSWLGEICEYTSHRFFWKCCSQHDRKSLKVFRENMYTFLQKYIFSVRKFGNVRMRSNGVFPQRGRINLLNEFLRFGMKCWTELKGSFHLNWVRGEKVKKIAVLFKYVVW